MKTCDFEDDTPVAFRLTSDQIDLIFEQTRTTIRTIYLPRKDLIKCALIGARTRENVLPLARSLAHEMWDQIRKGADVSLKGVFLELTDDQREQVRQLAGVSLAKAVYSPAETYLAYQEQWRPEKYPISVGSFRIHLDSLDVVAGEPGDSIDLLLGSGISERYHIFGTGVHEATQLALLQLERFVRRGQSVLDVGTGSGILAVAAARLGAARVHAIDIVSEAVTAAVETVRLNDMEHVIDVSEEDVFRVEGAYDLAVANILAVVLINIAEPVSSRIKSGGILITSGVTEEMVDPVVETMEDFGLRFVSQMQAGRWVSQVFRKDT